MALFVLLAGTVLGVLGWAEVHFNPEGSSRFEGRWQLGVEACRVSLLLGASWLSCRAAGQRLTDAGLRLGDAGLRVAQGVGMGSLAVGLSCAVSWASGAVQLTSSPAPLRALVIEGLSLAALFGLAAASEELVARGVLLQQLARGLGWPVAVAATSVLFGAAHLFNPGANALAVVNVALVGVWLGLLVVRTGSLWASVGVHWGWNFCEGFVLGQPVSGLTFPLSLVRRVAFTDGGFWSGATFGPEASLPTGAVLLVAIALCWRWPEGLFASQRSCRR